MENLSIQIAKRPKRNEALEYPRVGLVSNFFPFVIRGILLIFRLKLKELHLLIRNQS